jgi:hypothetical protein
MKCRFRSFHCEYEPEEPHSTLTFQGERCLRHGCVASSVAPWPRLARCLQASEGRVRQRRSQQRRIGSGCECAAAREGARRGFISSWVEQGSRRAVPKGIGGNTLFYAHVMDFVSEHGLPLSVRDSVAVGACGAAYATMRSLVCVLEGGRERQLLQHGGLPSASAERQLRVPEGIREQHSGHGCASAR